MNTSKNLSKYSFDRIYPTEASERFRSSIVSSALNRGKLMGKSIFDASTQLMQPAIRAANSQTIPNTNGLGSQLSLMAAKQFSALQKKQGAQEKEAQEKKAQEQGAQERGAQRKERRIKLPNVIERQLKRLPIPRARNSYPSLSPKKLDNPTQLDPIEEGEEQIRVIKPVNEQDETFKKNTPEALRGKLKGHVVDAVKKAMLNVPILRKEVERNHLNVSRVLDRLDKKHLDDISVLKPKEERDETFQKNLESFLRDLEKLKTLKTEPDEKVKLNTALNFGTLFLYMVEQQEVFLIEAALKINSMFWVLKRKESRETALHLAAKNNDVNMIKLLLRHQADVRALTTNLLRPVDLLPQSSAAMIHNDSISNIRCMLVSGTVQ